MQCKNPVFDFHLNLIEDCISYNDESGKISANWFYLTCGYYRIVAGNSLLLNYSYYQAQRWKQNPPIPKGYFFRTLQKNYPSYVDYFAARLWEDLIGMLSTIREPLPKLLESIMNDPIQRGDKAYE